MIKFAVNGNEAYSEQPGDTPLLWVIRDELGLTGTKFGCGVAQCGACTVHVNGQSVRACVTPVSAVAGKKVTTIEGLSPGATIHCRKRGSPSRCRSAATASRARSCRRRRSSRRRRVQPMRKSTPPWPATSVAAAPTSASAVRFTARRAVRGTSCT